MKTIRQGVLLLALLVLVASVGPSVNAQGGLPVATLACEQYLRSQPSMTAAPLDIVYEDEPLMLITGQDVTGGWLVVLRQNGQVGWMGVSDCLQVAGSLNNAPLTAPAVYEGPPVATIGCTQYVRSEPRNDAPALLVLSPEDGVLNVVGRAETPIAGASPEWLLVQRADGEMGWVYDTACIRTQGNMFDAPVSDVVMPVPNEDGSLPPTLETDLPTATIGCTQYVRSAPRSDSARLLILYPDDGILEIIGRDRLGEWLLVRRADGAMGWVVDTQCIVPQDDVFDAPLAVNVEMPVPGISPGSVGMLIYPEDETITAPSTLTLPEPYVTLGCPNYVRSAANNDSARLAIFNPGEGPLEILARDQPGEWLLVRRFDGAMGWVVNTQCVLVTGNVFEVPQDTSVVMPIPGVTNGDMSAVAELLENSEAPPEFAAPLPGEPVITTPEPYAQLSCANYVRSAADNAAARLTILYPGDGPLEIIARDKPAAWLLAVWDGGMGWIVNTSCVNVVGNVFDAPEDTSLVMPIPEPEPAPDPLPFPGAVPAEGWTG
jgi:SH3-like domain-containing protein